MNNFDNEAHAKYRNQVVYSTMLVFFKNAFQYVNSIQPSLFQGWFKNFRVSHSTGLSWEGEDSENVYLSIVLEPHNGGVMPVLFSVVEGFYVSMFSLKISVSKDVVVRQN